MQGMLASNKNKTISERTKDISIIFREQRVFGHSCFAEEVEFDSFGESGREMALFENEVMAKRIDEAEKIQDQGM